MKSAERGEINTHNFVMCSRHNQDASGNGLAKSPCTCNRQAHPGSGATGFQSKASQNFQKTFRQGNFVYHGSRRSNDFSTIQAKQSAQLSSGHSPFAAANNNVTPSFNQNGPPYIHQNQQPYNPNAAMNAAASQYAAAAHSQRDEHHHGHPHHQNMHHGTP